MAISARGVALRGFVAPLSARAIALGGLVVAVASTVVVHGPTAVSVTSSGVAAAVADVDVSVSVQSATRRAEASSSGAVVAVDRRAIGLSLSLPVGQAVALGGVGTGVAVGYSELAAAVVRVARGANVSATLARAVAAADVGARAAGVAYSERGAQVVGQTRAATLRNATPSVSPMAYTITRGDSLPLLDATLTSGGTAQNLAGASVQLVAVSPTKVSWTKSMAIVSAPAGTVRATFTTAETAALDLGAHRAFIRVTFGYGSQLTFPEGDTGFELTVARGPA